MTLYLSPAAPLPVPSSYGARGADSSIPGFERVESQGWSIVSPLSTQPMRDNCLATLGMADRVSSSEWPTQFSDSDLVASVPA